MKLRLPWPPSGNNYRTVARGRLILSTAGRAYREAALYAILAQHPAKDFSSARWALHLELCPPDRRRRDLSNFWKQAEDALVHAGILADDSQVDRITAERGPVEAGGAIYATLERIEKRPGR